MKKIDFDNDSIKKNILQAALPMLAAQILSLLYNITVEQVEEKIGGIRCGGRPTSCGDQLAKACREALEASQNA